MYEYKVQAIIFKVHFISLNTSLNTYDDESVLIHLIFGQYKIYISGWIHTCILYYHPIISNSVICTSLVILSTTIHLHVVLYAFAHDMQNFILPYNMDDIMYCVFITNESLNNVYWAMCEYMIVVYIMNEI